MSFISYGVDSFETDHLQLASMIGNCAQGMMLDGVSFALGGKSLTEGDPSAPCLCITNRGGFKFRAKVLEGGNTFTIRAKQVCNLSPRPSFKVWPNPSIGLNEPVETFADSDTGWTEISVNISVTGDGAVWLEMRNNINASNGQYPCYFDHQA
jgi:hypothetical protein